MWLMCLQQQHSSSRRETKSKPNSQRCNLLTMHSKGWLTLILCLSAVQAVLFVVCASHFMLALVCG